MKECEERRPFSDAKCQNCPSAKDTIFGHEEHSAARVSDLLDRVDRLLCQLDNISSVIGKILPEHAKEMKVAVPESLNAQVSVSGVDSTEHELLWRRSEYIQYLEDMVKCMVPVVHDVIVVRSTHPGTIPFSCVASMDRIRELLLNADPIFDRELDLRSVLGGLL